VPTSRKNIKSIPPGQIPKYATGRYIFNVENLIYLTFKYLYIFIWVNNIISSHQKKNMLLPFYFYKRFIHIASGTLENCCNITYTKRNLI